MDRNKFSYALLGACALLFCVSLSANADVILQTTFDADAEGWVLTHRDGTDITAPTYVATGGAPGTGFIRYAVDSINVGFAEAPSSWHGDRSAAYGGTISYWARNNLDPSSRYEDTDVLLFSSIHGYINYDFSNNPTTEWDYYSAPLTETGWRTGNGDSGSAVSQQLMKDVLANLSDLRVRIEYRTGGDSDDLDTITMTTPGAQVPEPGTASLVLAAGALGLLIRRLRA